MSEFNIILGNMRSGKTTYAKTKEGYIYIPHDGLLNMCNNNFEEVSRYLQSILEDNQDKNFIIDGWFSTYNMDPDSIRRFQCQHKIKITVFYASFDWLRLDPRNTKEFVGFVYNYIMKFYRDDLKDYDFEFRDAYGDVYTFEEFSNLVRNDMTDATPQDVEDFKTYLSQKDHDRYYQTIRLPFKNMIQGYERTELTWDILKKEVNWRGKTVLDIGSYHGYTDFGAVDNGAKTIVGLDYTSQAIDIANRLKNIWKYNNINFYLDNVTSDKSMLYDCNFDIVTCLNTLQYFGQAKTNLHDHVFIETLKKVFNAGKLVIFEACEQYKPVLDKVASENNHMFIKELESPRWRDLKRMLYFYGKCPHKESVLIS